MWDVNNLKKIDEFEKLDYWTLMKISELLNKFDDKEELEESVSEYQDEIDDLEYEIRQKDRYIEHLEDTVTKCYNSDSLEESKGHIKKFCEDNWYYSDNLRLWC